MRLRDGGTYEPSAEDVANWKQAYPGLAVDAELSKMRAWLDANPGKRKTKAGIRRFIVSWLNRASETGGSPAITADDVQEVEGPFGAFEKDEIYQKLQEVMEFYNKQVSRTDLRIWMQALTGFRVTEIRGAMDDYLLRGKFAPKPVDVLEILQERRQREQTRRPAEEREQPWNPGDPEIARAWMWYIGNFMAGERMAGLFPPATVEPEVADRYLHLVNVEAHRLGHPDAILEEHKLQEVWG